jgi:hypothetical protein
MSSWLEQALPWAGGASTGVLLWCDPHSLMHHKCCIVFATWDKARRGWRQAALCERLHGFSSDEARQQAGASWRVH